MCVSDSQRIHGALCVCIKPGCNNRKTCCNIAALIFEACPGCVVPLEKYIFRIMCYLTKETKYCKTFHAFNDIKAVTLMLATITHLIALT